MDDSIYLLPYRLGELKPDVLRTLEERISSVTTPIQEFVLLYLFFPYARYALTGLVTFLAVVVPIGILFAVPVTLIVGVPTIMGYLSTPVATLHSSPLYLAAIPAGAYSLALLGYKPTDKNDYTTVSTPTDPPEWETMFNVMASGMFPLSFFLLHWYPNNSALLSVTGQSPLVVAILAGLLAKLCVVWWFDHRYTTMGWGACPKKNQLLGGFMFSFPAWIGYLSLIAFDIDLLVFGPSNKPAVAGFYLLVVWNAFTLRRLRWTVYEDWAGFRTIHPTLRLWGLPRIVFMFALFAVVAGAPISNVLVICVVTPTIGGTAYILWRLWVTGDMMVNPDGTPGAGRRAYESAEREARENIERIGDAISAVNEFNEFAVNTGLDRLPDEQSIANFDPDAVRVALDRIDASQARELTGATFTEYVEYRDTLRNELDQL